MLTLPDRKGVKCMAKGVYTSDLSLDEKVMLGVVRVSELFKKESSTLFRNYGLTFSQYNVVRVLCSSENGQNTITNIRKIMYVSGANMTGLAKRLERNGFLIRKGDPNDERIKLLEITPKGRQTLKNITREKDQFVQELLEDYSDELKLEIVTRIKKMIDKQSMISL